MLNLLLVKPKAEQFAIDECTKKDIPVRILTSGIIENSTEINFGKHNFCFLFCVLQNVNEITISNGNSIDSVSNWFCQSIKNDTFEESWNLVWLTNSENGFLIDIPKNDKLKEKLKKRISRISKLADTTYPEINKNASGLFVVAIKGIKKIYLSRSAVFFGQRRMKDDSSAPSRSYLKVEEAFSIFNRTLGCGDTVVDLGAAPGGWTWAALKRGAIVYAIDNGSLKKGPHDHPNVKHIKHDAYTWCPQTKIDWLFCDMVDQPFKVIDRILTYFSNRWCRYAIVNLKYGHSNPGKILDLLYSPKGFLPFSKRLICRHLFHDRDEITVMAEIK